MSSGSRTPSLSSASIAFRDSDSTTCPSASTSTSITPTSPMRSSRSTGVISASGSRTSSSRRSSISSVTSTAGRSAGVSWETSPSVTCGITVIVAFSRAGRPRSSSSTSTSGLSIGSIDLSRIACCSTSGMIVSTTSSRSAAGPMRASISWRGARPGRKPSIFARDARRFSTRS